MSLTGQFRALVARQTDHDTPSLAVESLPFEALGQGDVLIRVRWSGLNYKDALAARGHRGVIKQLPHVPGIDAAGEVAQSDDPRFTVGRQVLVTGYELGCERWGGFAQYIRVPADWVIPLPDALTARDAMLLGTAGFTAAQAVQALIENRIIPASGPIVVTGAGGGVGSIAVQILAKLGYSVTAVSGKEAAFAHALGAAQVLPRESIVDHSSKPLLRSQWAGAIDTVGGMTLASLVRGMQHRGCIAACGLVGGTELPLTVYPFILRGVRLIGIDSAWCPATERPGLWGHLAGDWRPKSLAALLDSEVSLDELPPAITRILAGEIRGRVLVRID